jgi:hypothetical protein
MRKLLGRLGVALIILLVVIQFVRPARNNPPEQADARIESHLAMQREVRGIFERSCADCHSNRTEWPWYSNVAPVSWFVAGHVDHARRHMNLSTWTEYDTPKIARILDRMCAFTRDGQMPLASYLFMHGDARLSEEDVQEICGWALAAREVLLEEETRMEITATPATEDAPERRTHR